MTTGEQVGAAVDQSIKEAEVSAQDQIARAKADADAAAAQAKQIADAALSTELGTRIQANRQEFETWRTATDQRIAEMSATNQKTEAALAEATTLFGSIRALLTPTQTEPKPPPSAETGADAGQTVVNSTKTEPSEKPKGAAAETPAPEAPRKRHFL